jgi:hypothetical protein
LWVCICSSRQSSGKSLLASLESYHRVVYERVGLLGLVIIEKDCCSGKCRECCLAAGYRHVSTVVPVLVYGRHLQLLAALVDGPVKNFYHKALYWEKSTLFNFFKCSE